VKRSKTIVSRFGIRNSEVAVKFIVSSLTFILMNRWLCVLRSDQRETNKE